MQLIKKVVGISSYNKCNSDMARYLYLAQLSLISNAKSPFSSGMPEKGIAPKEEPMTAKGGLRPS